jgi:hypothetical protein
MRRPYDIRAYSPNSGAMSKARTLLGTRLRQAAKLPQANRTADPIMSASMASSLVSDRH